MSAQNAGKDPLTATTTTTTTTTLERAVNSAEDPQHYWPPNFTTIYEYLWPTLISNRQQQSQELEHPIDRLDYSGLKSHHQSVSGAGGGGQLHTTPPPLLARPVEASSRATSATGRHHRGEVIQATEGKIFS